MPSTPRGHNAATLCAVVLTIVLAFAWLRSSDGGSPRVPAGLSVTTLPAAAPEEPAVPDDAAPTRGIEEEGADGGRGAVGKPKRSGAERAKRSRGERAVAQKTKHRRADRAGGPEDARARREARARARRGQDPPATAPAPQSGSGTVESIPPTGGRASTPAPPEFALE